MSTDQAPDPYGIKQKLISYDIRMNVILKRNKGKSFEVNEDEGGSHGLRGSKLDHETADEDRKQFVMQLLTESEINKIKREIANAFN